MVFGQKRMQMNSIEESIRISIKCNENSELLNSVFLLFTFIL